MVRQLDEIIYSIDVPLPGNPLRNLNSFLIKGDARNLLIDTGFNMPECFKALKNGLDELEVDINKTDILLTHMHADHMGLAPSIAESGTRVYMGRIDLEIFKKLSDSEYISERDAKYLAFGFSSHELRESKTVNPAIIFLPDQEVEYIPIEDSHVFKLGSVNLECIMTPGHTPGHMCLYDRSRKMFLSGDHILFGISPNIISWSSIPDSLGAYLESLKKVRQLDIERTFAAHRVIEGDIKGRIDELIKHHHQRLDEAESIVRAKKKSTVYEIASEMTWSIRTKNWQTFPVAQKWFALGETHSHLEYLRVRGKINLELKAGLMYYSI